jgi:hypothetical protein
MSVLIEAKETDRRVTMGLCWGAFESLVRMERAYGACMASKKVGRRGGCDVTAMRKAQRNFEKHCVRERV